VLVIAVVAGGIAALLVGRSDSPSPAPVPVVLLALSTQLGILWLALLSLVGFNSKEQPEAETDNGRRRDSVNVARCHQRHYGEMKNGQGVDMGNTSLIRTALLIALITAFGFAATGRSPAADLRCGIDEDRASRFCNQTSDGRGQLPWALTIGLSCCFQPFCCASI
jgi:hypothetical protein